MHTSRAIPILVALGALGAALVACAASGITPTIDDGDDGGGQPDGGGGPGDPTAVQDAGDAAVVPFTCTPSPAPSSSLVINEVDYDQPGLDLNEFVEIYNADTTKAVTLDRYQVVFFNGVHADAGTPYAIYPLSGSLSPGGYLVIGAGRDDGGIDAGGAQFIALQQSPDGIQNGPRDAIAIVDRETHQIIDSLVYDGNLSTPCNLSEGTPTTARDSDGIGGSLIRYPNGTDTNEASTDWKFTTTTTAGSENVLTP